MTLAELRAAFPRVSPLDFTLLLVQATGQNQVFLLTHPEWPMPSSVLKKAKSLLRRRVRREPIAYILGHKEFYGREFEVNRHTLIPRPETEILVEAALEGIPKSSGSADIVDLGTGSGNIIITLALELKEKRYRFFAGDISLPALKVAKKNAKGWGKKKITFLKSNLLESFHKKNLLHASSIYIVANLPYVSKKVFRHVSTDVRYEPEGALVSDRHGLAHYKRLLKEIRTYFFEKNLTLFLEISPEQASRLRKFVATTLPTASLSFIRDLSKRNRVAIVKIERK